MSRDRTQHAIGRIDHLSVPVAGVDLGALGGVAPLLEREGVVAPDTLYTVRRGPGKTVRLVGQTHLGADCSVGDDLAVTLGASADLLLSQRAGRSVSVRASAGDGTRGVLVDWSGEGGRVVGDDAAHDIRGCARWLDC